MARPSVTTVRELEPQLRSRAPVSATEMARVLGVNRATITRVLPDFGPDLVTMGAARATRYALRRDIRGAGKQWPIHRIDESGRASEWGRLDALHERLWRIHWSGDAPQHCGFTKIRGFGVMMTSSFSCRLRVRICRATLFWVMNACGERWAAW